MDDSISITEWYEDFTRRLALFVSDYREANKIDSEKFPLDLPGGAFDEFFDNFDGDLME